jgi:hypothetical protein
MDGSRWRNERGNATEEWGQESVFMWRRGRKEAGKEGWQYEQIKRVGKEYCEGRWDSDNNAKMMESSIPI